MSVTWNIIDNHSVINGTHDVSLFADGVWVAQAHVELLHNVPFLTAFDVHPAYYGYGAAAEFYKQLSNLEKLPVLIAKSLATTGNGRTAADNLIHQFDSAPAGNDTPSGIWWTESFDPKLIERAKTNPRIAVEIGNMEFYVSVLEAEAV